MCSHLTNPAQDQTSTLFRPLKLLITTVLHFRSHVVVGGKLKLGQTGCKITPQ